LWSKSGSALSKPHGRDRPGLWEASLDGIRKANIVIENIIYFNGPEEERNVILGQAYFFRAYFHNEIMKVTKGTAYAFQGKNLLLAASPLMRANNGPDLDTYKYDKELCDMAVDAFSEILKLADQGYYALATWENYDDVFWRSPAPRALPGGTEYIFSATGMNNQSIQSFMLSGMPRDNHNKLSETVNPTHNYIHNNFGMANGLSIEDDISGKYGAQTYDATNPFANRDPRFYRWHIIDGQEIAPRAPNNLAINRTAQLWYVSESEKGVHADRGDARPGALRNTTGYIQSKFYPIIDGEYHSRWNNIIDRYVGVRLHMRLTDVYLMYAEALHASKGAQTAPASYSLTAEEAINKFRNRAGIPNVHPNIVTESNKFMDEIRRERAVELSYESHRWLDIRRWGVAHLEKYKTKLGLNFPEDHSSFTPFLVKDRICEYPKHYWLPFQTDQTQMYEGFPQNPGW
jgi:hypothetical protein